MTSPQWFSKGMTVALPKFWRQPKRYRDIPPSWLFGRIPVRLATAYRRSESLPAGESADGKAAQTVAYGGGTGAGGDAEKEEYLVSSF